MELQILMIIIYYDTRTGTVPVERYFCEITVINVNDNPFS